MPEFAVDPKKFVAKICPYFPPLVTPPRLQGQPPTMNYGVCVGTNCMLWDQCQGELSPRANAVRAKAILRGAIDSLKNGSESFLGRPLVDALEWVRASLETALKSNTEGN